MLTATDVKQKARELGADAVGIVSAAVLNAHPPDPRFPQTPERISPEINSVVAIVKRIPAGAFRTKRLECVQYMDQFLLCAHGVERNVATSPSRSNNGLELSPLLRVWRRTIASTCV